MRRFVAGLLVILITYSIGSLADSRSEPSALKSAQGWVKDQGFVHKELVFDTNCDHTSCQIRIYPQAFAASLRNMYRGCPSTLCVTLTYDIKSQSITKHVFWR
ncbi:hypothetical protein N483_18000 [Pseudoalteromonas luteoviolacea NCIMB 1944]|uniref:Uncharacterized protein n=1 Tax=Pseudoalteromonas luteoviolacea (strain 2ta16) TaxID=1353533 RepID=V4HNU3_PSEL2|nr:hypothetical protein PL2TA16_00232 [Pseudoalteromonas luteoviolacea 2ta16]KZN40081.1 hypothetical protein N483_18000 [Pseudoalteromonas luteoviolacea NCIMB 1944]